MKHIIKGKEPESLKTYRTQTDGASYDGYREKDDLRKALLEEQGYICCYCMGRIKDPTSEFMKIEHWKPQDLCKSLEDLDYSNLLAACLGKSGTVRHCDTKKHETPISIHPADPQRNCEDLINYTANGIIKSQNPDIQKDIDVTLNLNAQTLRDNRVNALKRMLKLIKPNRQNSKQFLQRKVVELNSKQKGKFQPYCHFISSFLQKRLDRLNKKS